MVFRPLPQAHWISVSKFIMSVIKTRHSSSYIQNIFLFKTQSHLKITILLGRKILLRSLQVYTQKFLPLKTVCTRMLALETVSKVYQLFGSQGGLMIPSHYIHNLLLSARRSSPILKLIASINNTRYPYPPVFEILISWESYKMESSVFFK